MNVDALPDWPRILRAELAAAYCGVSEGAFRTMVKVGFYPNPVIKRGGIVAWDKAQIDKFIDRMASGDAVSKDNDAEIDDWFRKMPRNTLAGIHRVRMNLKGHRITFYHYAWRGGPRFWSSESAVKEGSAQYFAAFAEAGKLAQDKSGKFRDIIRMYMASTNFRRLSARSQKDIRYSLFRENGIDAKFGNAPIGAFNRPKIRQAALR